MTKTIREKIILAGGSGFIGSKLAKKLASAGYEIVILTRFPRAASANSSIRYVGWDDRDLGGWTQEIESSKAIVNLAGESIAGESLPTILFSRWTFEKKKAIRDSRISTGKVLAKAVLKAKKKPKVFIQASGIGYYGTSSSGPIDEDSPPGSDFLSSVSQDWEESSRGVISCGVRHVVIRSGVVLDPSGGILPLVALPIKLFLGGKLGNGSQYFPWIHIGDEIDAIKYLIENQSCNGAFNLVAPELATNVGFGKTLAAILNRPFYLPIPTFLLKLLLGEKSVLVLEGQQANPRGLLDAGFTFNFPGVEIALNDLYRND